MRIGKFEGKKKTVRRGEQVILFTAGGYTFACPATAVDEIRPAEGLQPIATGFAHSRLARVKFSLEHDGKTFFVVDANLHFRILPSHPTRLLVLRDAPVAVLVDSIERMADVAALHALPRAFSGEECAWYRGLIVIDGNVVPVVNPGAFLSAAELAIVAASAVQLKPAGVAG